MFPTNWVRDECAALAHIRFTSSRHFGRARKSRENTSVTCNPSCLFFFILTLEDGVAFCFSLDRAFRSCACLPAAGLSECPPDLERLAAELGGDEHQLRLLD